MKKLSSDEKITIQSYDKNANEWAKDHAHEIRWYSYIKKFNQLLPSGKIIEIGSGGGRDAKQLIKIGYEYIGIDASEGLLAIARKNNPGAKFLGQNVYQLDFLDISFDGFWCVATLLHLPKNKINTALSEIHRVMKPSALGFISVKKGRGERLVYEPPPDETRFFAFYHPEEFKTILTQNGFEIISFEEVSKSNKTTWLIYFVKAKK